MNTRSMTASANNGANNNTNGATKQRRRAKKPKRTKREDPATKRYRLKSLDLQQKIRLALEARRIASLTNPQIPGEFHPSFRGSGGIPAPAVEDDIAREQETPNATAAQEGIDSVRTSNKRARSPEGSEASSDSFYYDAEDFITDKESATMPPNRKRVRFNGPEPTMATEAQLAQRRDSREATAADGPEFGVAAEESLTSSLEVLELAEESLAPRVFVTPNPNVNQPFIRVVTVDSEAEFTQKMNDGDDTPVSYFDFGPEFQLSDLHIHEILLRRPSFFRASSK
ncbi:hypothetical protein CGGC5_v015110 [Colletotrichum fructicola Nara gc5]|uniref:Uncharacterized protein n=1 Tax=Colletotrichum fructicola (strain Nara gc5) TaxID=1213859 RepID=A0A7J6IJ46_COLFN|nr:hypothetical protein CGGC5_v015110 [Colletotrichum fructicola Nara gc5]